MFRRDAVARIDQGVAALGLNFQPGGLASLLQTTTSNL